MGCQGAACSCCGQDREWPLRFRGQALIGSRASGSGWWGAADSSFVGQQVAAADSGQAAPDGGSGDGGAQVREGLAGDVTLQAAHDLLLGFALDGPPFDVGPGGGMGAHAGEDDAPQGVVGVAVTGGVEGETAAALA